MRELIAYTVVFNLRMRGVFSLTMSLQKVFGSTNHLVRNGLIILL